MSISQSRFQRCMTIIMMAIGCTMIIQVGVEGAELFRPPAVPLITHDPYFSIWSMNDRLTDDWTKHWTGKTNAICGYIRIDGSTLRLIGPDPKEIPAMEQIGLEIFPTRTLYRFTGKGIALDLTFLTPLLPHDLDVLSRPLSYVTWTVKSTDEHPHSVSLYFDVTGEWTVNEPHQKIAWSRFHLDGVDVMRMGTVEQPILEKSGDNLRIDWGYGYLAVPTGQSAQQVFASNHAARDSFVKTGALPVSDDLDMPRPVERNWPVMASVFDLEVSNEPVERHIMLAYDDIDSILYFQRKLEPYWKTKIADIAELIQTANREYESLKTKCEKYDQELMEDMEKAGGSEYAQLCVLAFRQCLAAHKLAADFDGTPLYFSKENFSNGCIATVDVTYPASPFFLLFNTELLKAQIRPILDYAQSKRWKFPFSPHDLGTYPHANGQRYGGGEVSEENQMPVEESGNVLLMLAAIAHVDGNAEFARAYWPTITQWANFLKEQGLDPSNQLCTDDFAGHLAHNTNLSLKAILALGGYSQLCNMLGYENEAKTYLDIAHEMAEKWLKMADDSDHYRLAFDKPGTWSQKYNLIWDDLLNLNLFPKELAPTEIAYYKTVMNPYGLPLDNREKYTKIDWELWTASLTHNREDFLFFVKPIYKFLQETPDRVPMTDWYWTQNGKCRGFQARSVVGGLFVQMMMDPAIWKKWANR